MAIIRRACTPDDVERVRELFREYAASLDFALCFQDFDRELASLPGEYAEPRGCLLLAVAEDRAAGCVALRPLETHTCEIKRLFVRPACRGQGSGLALTREALEQARLRGYRRVRLDTAPGMEQAQRMYARLGFREIPLYHDYGAAAPEGLKAMELTL